MKSQKSYKKTFSFELFPPKTDVGAQKLKTVVEALNALSPKFFSVTFGAGGSTQERTLDTVLEMSKNGYDVAPHISCIGSTKDSIRNILKQYQSNGIKRLVALRGDMPSGMLGAGELNYANELVSFIREETGNHFHIEVAGYPEFHPQSLNAESDIRYFVEKVNAGADSVITQYFYNADAYFRFVDACEKQNLNIQIVPGIMPIGNFTQLARFSDNCGAEIPRWMRKRFESFGDDKVSINAYGIEVVTDLCQRLLDAGAPGLHFYTLNKVEPTLSIWQNLGLDNA